MVRQLSFSDGGVALFRCTWRKRHDDGKKEH